MKSYIKNIEDLNELLGYEQNEYEGEEIGYGEKAVVFIDVTNECKGRTKAEKLEDFLENGEIGTCFYYKAKCLCKVIDVLDEPRTVYEDAKGNICEY